MEVYVYDSGLRNRHHYPFPVAKLALYVCYAYRTREHIRIQFVGHDTIEGGTVVEVIECSGCL